MTLLMEEDVALDPENVDFLGAEGVVFDTEWSRSLDLGLGMTRVEVLTGLERSGLIWMRFGMKLFRYSAHFEMLTMIEKFCYTSKLIQNNCSAQDARCDCEP